VGQSAEQLLTAAEALSADDRIELIEALIAGLNADGLPDLSPEQLNEIARRSAEIDAGRVTPIPWSQAQAG
jgi:putative addiction module component (TIGR02574 family)